MRQQVRRVVAVAVLAARGALPADAFEVLTRRDVVLPTPLPPDLAYFAGARYDFVEKRGAGRQKRATFPTSKAPRSAVFHSFRLTFGRAVISRNGLEAWMLFPERARAEHSR